MDLRAQNGMEPRGCLTVDLAYFLVPPASVEPPFALRHMQGSGALRSRFKMFRRAGRIVCTLVNPAASFLLEPLSPWDGPGSFGIAS